MKKNQDDSRGEKNVAIIKSLQALEEYKKIISNDVDITNPDGSIMRFTVHAITPVRFAEINADYQQSKPLMPSKNLDRDGKEREDSGYQVRVKKYERNLAIWTLKENCWVILAGWVEPENIEMAGKTDADKIDELFKTIPAVGDQATLARAISKVSRLDSDDVEFM